MLTLFLKIPVLLYVVSGNGWELERTPLCGPLHSWHRAGYSSPVHRLPQTLLPTYQRSGKSAKIYLIGSRNTTARPLQLTNQQLKRDLSGWTSIYRGYQTATNQLEIRPISGKLSHFCIHPIMDQVYQWKGPSHWLNHDLPHTARFQQIRDQMSQWKGPSHWLNNDLPHTARFQQIRDQMSQWKGPFHWLNNDLPHTARFQPMRDQMSQWKGPFHWLNNDLPHTARFQPITGSGVSMQRHLAGYLGKNSSVSSGAGYHRLEIALESQWCTSSNSSYW